MHPSSKMPQSVADQLNQKLSDWLKFTEDDLASNRQRKISPAQRRKWWKDLFLWFGLVLLGGVIGFFIAGDSSKWGVLGFFLVFGIFGVSWQVIGRLVSRVNVAIGTVQLHTRHKGVYSYYFLLIDGKKLKLPHMPQEGLFLNGIQYRVYYKAKGVQSIEIASESIQKSI